MEFLGTVGETVDNGTAIVICTEDLPDIGNPVFDSNKSRIGVVKRIFGPVKEPFVTVAVEDAAVLKKLKGKDLYTTRRTQNGKDKGRNRRG
jgi:rRNA processing protein Gar1